MRVRVEPYSPEWAAEFLRIKEELQGTLEGVNIVSIEHVGSTSVPGLAAKPVIDIDVIVPRASVTASITALTTNGGYKYVGEWGIEDRHAFRKPPGSKPDRNLYVCVEDCAALRNHLGVRDLLRSSAKLRDQYGQLKLALSQQEHANVDEYCEAKNDIIQKILAETGMGSTEREEIRQSNVAVRDRVGLGSNP